MLKFQFTSEKSAKNRKGLLFCCSLHRLIQLMSREVIFHLKFLPEVNHPFKKRRLRWISADNLPDITDVTAGKNFQS